MKYNFDNIVGRRSSNSIKWTKYPEDVLPMWVADMDFAAPPPVLEALHKAVNHSILGYETPSKDLLATVAERMDKLYGWKIGPDMVVAVPGVVSGFNAAAKAACGSGEGVLMQPPVYFPFLEVHENQGLTRQFASLVQMANGNILQYEIDFDAFEAAMGSDDTRTGMFLFCNPHNPTGNAFSWEDLSRLAEICLQRNVVICSDEIHSELLLGRAQHTPIATLTTEITEQTITLVAPSKTFNTAGLFCSFAIIPNPDLRERYKQASKGLTFHINSLGQIAAQIAFSGACDDWLKELLSYLTANRDFVVEYVKEYMPEIHLTLPDASYLIWMDCNPLLESGKITGSPFEFFLNEAKVALSDGAQFGPGGEGFVRLNFGCPRNILVDALERIRGSLSLGMI